MTGAGGGGGESGPVWAWGEGVVRIYFCAGGLGSRVWFFRSRLSVAWGFGVWGSGLQIYSRLSL